MRRRSILSLALVALALVVAACAAASPLDLAEDALRGGRALSSEMAEPAAPPVAAPMAPKEAPSGGANYGYSADDAAAAPGALYQTSVTDSRMIIRTANVSILVKDTDEVLDSLSGMVAGYGGYVADSNQWYSNEQLYANLTVRVPAESLDQFLDELGELAVRVESQNTSSDDVTEEYVDIQARLRNLEATEEELFVLLTEVRENRGKAEEVLAIHRELTSIRGQIESLQGRKQFLERMTALSTVHLQIRPEAAPRTVIEERWNPLVTVSNAARTLVSVVQGFLSVAIYLLVLSPLVLLPLAVLWLLAWVLRRRRRASGGAAEA